MTETRNPDGPRPDIQHRKTRAERGLRLHGILCAAGIMVLFIAHARFEWSWPVLWPVLIWAAVLTLHAAYVRLTNVNAMWVSRRADQIKQKGYSDIYELGDGTKPDNSDGDKTGSKQG